MRKFKTMKRNPLSRAVSLALLPTLGISAVPAVLAQDAVLEEIIVTSSRREESVQDIPINIAAVSNEKIEDLRLFGVAEIANYVPGLTVIDRGPRDEIPDILVRGLNTSGLGPGFSSDTVATYLGEIPLQVDLKPIDLERVEVLIGPQGTLYGQGTMGGAIRYIPKRADYSDGFTVDLRGGMSQNEESDGITTEAGLTMNIPLVEDTLAMRLNVDRLDDEGFIDYNFVVREAGVSNPEPSPSDRDANLRRVEDANGEETISARLNLRWTPTDWLDASLWYYYQDTEAEGRQINNRLSFGTGRYESGLRYEEPNDYQNELLSIEAAADLGWAELTFVYGESEYEELGQRDQTDLLLNFEYGYEAFPTFSSFTREAGIEEVDTLEVRLTSQHDGPISWVAGYFNNDVFSDFISEEFTPGFDQFAVDNFGGVQLRPDSLEYIQLTFTDETEEAFYGEVTYDINEKWEATIGYRRYDFEVNNRGGFGLPLFETVFLGAPQDVRLETVSFGENAGDDSGDLFKFNVAYDVDEDNMVYFTYSEGYRNGGVNSVPECTPEQLASPNQQLCAQEDEVFIDPDTIDNYEIGYKGLLADGTFNANVALFFIDWKDLQVDTVTDLGNLPITGNGSAAESKGLEFQGRWLINDNWEASATYAYTNAKLTENAPGLVGPFDALSGTRLPGHAEHQGTFNITYDTTVWDDVDLTVNYGFIYSGDIFNIPGGDEDTLVDSDGNPGDRGGEAVPSYDVHHLSATFAKDNWTVQAYVDNLFDEYYVVGTRTSRRFLQDEQTGPGNNIGGFTLRSYGQFVGAPRNLGVRLTYSF